MFNDRTISEKARQLEADNIAYALATVVRCKAPTSAQPGYKALVTAAGDIYGWIGGGCVQPAVIKTVRQVLGDGLPQLIRVSPVADAPPEHDLLDFRSACYSGGSLDIFIEPMLAQPELLIMGATAVARSLAGLAHFAGFNVTVASPEVHQSSFSLADRLVTSFDPGDIHFSSAPLVVVATQGKGDQAALQAAINIGAGHLAFIASRRKASRLKQILKDKGYDPDAVESIIAPAGIAIGARTPQEIAVSVVAALVAARNAHIEPSNIDKPSLQDAALPDGAPAAAEEGASTAVKAAAAPGCCGSNPAS